MRDLTNPDRQRCPRQARTGRNEAVEGDGWIGGVVSAPIALCKQVFDIMLDLFGEISYLCHTSIAYHNDCM